MKNKLATSIVFFYCFFTSVNTNAQDPDSVQNNEFRRVTVTVNGNLLSQRLYVYLYTQNEDSAYEELMPFEEYYFPGCMLINSSDIDLMSQGDSVYCFLKVVTNTIKRKYVEQDLFFFPLEPKWFAGKGALIVDIILTKGKRGWSRDPNVGESWQGYPFKVVLHVGHLSIVMEEGYIHPDEYPE